MTYTDIFEFQSKLKTKDKMLEAFSKMTDIEAKKLISTCGTPQGKLCYTKMYNESKQHK